jgi:hypothetical protein
MVVRIKCGEELWSLAVERAATKPVYANSHRKRAANELGCLGEVAAELWMIREKVSFSDETSCTTHDYRLANGATVDVKTKDRTVPPLATYDCSVPAYNHSHQLPDYYLFVSLQRDKAYPLPASIRRFTHAYILGGISLAQLESKGRRWNANEVDPANGTCFWTACINVRINQLEPPAKVAAIWSLPHIRQHAGNP